MSRRKNSFSKAIRHLKEAPTNSTSGLYSVVPGIQTRTTTEVGPTEPDFSTVDFDIDGANGQDTSGLFDGAGNHKFISPPGDNSYILGPMATMYYTYASPHWTRIGYIRESDRRMVNLGSFTGSLEDWDGVSNFQSYGQLTLEQAAWFKNTPKRGDYRAFYPGPPSSSPDAFGRYYCTITGTPLATHNPTVTTTNAPLDLQPEAIFAAILDRLKGAGKGVWDDLKNFGNWSKDTFGDKIDNYFAQTAVKLLRMVTDPLRFQGKYLFKGLVEGTKYNPAFTGGGIKIPIINPKGVKWADRFGALGRWISGKNYASQYFSPNYLKAIDYAKKGGKVVVIPRDQVNTVRGFKNWLKGSVSRGFGFGDIEKLVRTSDSIAAKNVTKIIDLGQDPNALKNLQKYASKGAKGNILTGKIGSKIIPGLNIAAVTYDVQDRIRQGDWAGAALGAIQYIPGPLGWAGLGGQLLLDSGLIQKGMQSLANKMADKYSSPEMTAKYNEMLRQGKIKVPFEEATESNDTSWLAEMGMTTDIEEYVREQSTHLLLMGVNPIMVSVLMTAISGEEFTKDQQEFVKHEMPKMAKMVKEFYEQSDVEELHPSNPLATEDDPWALQKQQTQESVVLSEERKLSIIKKLKEPVVIPETKQKSYKVRPGRRGKTNFQGMDKLVGDIKTQKSFKEPQDIWSDGWQGHNARLSQDKKNIVLEKIGEGKQAWEYMLKYGTKMDAKNLEEFWGKNPDFYSYCFDGKKYKPTRKEQVGGDYLVFLVDEVGKTSSMLQSELNEKLSEESDKEMLAEYNKTNEPIPFLDDPLVRRVAKRLKSQIDYPDKPAVKGYPNEEPPKMVNGMHPELGKRYKYDKLDPVSAIAMRNAPTGDPEIDDNVKKASVKPKVVEDKKENWRDTLTNA